MLYCIAWATVGDLNLLNRFDLRCKRRNKFKTRTNFIIFSDELSVPIQAGHACCYPVCIKLKILEILLKYTNFRVNMENMHEKCISCF